MLALTIAERVGARREQITILQSFAEFERENRNDHGIEAAIALYDFQIDALSRVIMWLDVRGRA